MLGTTEVAQNHDVLVLGVLSLLGVFTTAAVTWSKLTSSREAARNIADQVLAYLDTGNAHTAGQALVRLEDQLAAQSDRVDRVEVIATETQQSLAGHIADVQAQAEDYVTNVKPVVDRIRAIQEKGAQQGRREFDSQ